jgi:hypothetical protein
MKIPEAYIAEQLFSAPEVAEMIGDRVFPVIAPASAAIPFVVWRRTAVAREASLCGPTGITTTTIAVDMYAASYDGVRDLADRCRKTLDGFRGLLGNWIEVNYVSLQGEADGFIQLAGGELPQVYSVTQTYTILWQET